MYLYQVNNMSDKHPTKEQLEEELKAMEYMMRFTIESYRAKRELYRAMFPDNDTGSNNETQEYLNLREKRRIV